MKYILKDKKNQKDLDFDVLEKIQGRNWSVMGQSSKIWTSFELARSSLEGSVEDGLKEIQRFVEQTAGTSIEFHILLQKIFNAVGTNKLTKKK